MLGSPITRCLAFSAALGTLIGPSGLLSMHSLPPGHHLAAVTCGIISAFRDLNVINRTTRYRWFVFEDFARVTTDVYTLESACTALRRYFQATNQWLATNVSNHHHQYQDSSGNLESYFSGSDQGGCCTANNGQVRVCVPFVDVGTANQVPNLVCRASRKPNTSTRPLVHDSTHLLSS